MIVAYAQATDRQGLDAAVDGQTVRVDESRFAKLRQKAVSVNLTATPVHVGEVEVKYGKGVVRLALAGPDDLDATRSHVIVVADVSELTHDRGDAVLRAAESIRAIGRESDDRALESGFATGERVYRAIRTRRRIAVAATAVVITVAVIWLARSCAASGDVISSAGSWSR